MDRIVKLWCGYNWSLSRKEYLDTGEALTAEMAFNKRVKANGFTAHWRVGTAQVFGDRSERAMAKQMAKWREQAIKEATS